MKQNDAGVLFSVHLWKFQACMGKFKNLSQNHLGGMQRILPHENIRAPSQSELGTWPDGFSPTWRFVASVHEWSRWQVAANHHQPMILKELVPFPGSLSHWFWMVLACFSNVQESSPGRVVMVCKITAKVLWTSGRSTNPVLEACYQRVS